jgi:hypothetical protein
MLGGLQQRRIPLMLLAIRVGSGVEQDPRGVEFPRRHGAVKRISPACETALAGTCFDVRPADDQKFNDVDLAEEGGEMKACEAIPRPRVRILTRGEHLANDGFVAERRRFVHREPHACRADGGDDRFELLVKRQNRGPKAGPP